MSHYIIASDYALTYPPLLIKEVLKCEHHDALVSLMIATNHRVSLARAGAPICEYGCVESVENSLLSTEALVDYGSYASVLYNENIIQESVLDADNKASHLRHVHSKAWNYCGNTAKHAYYRLDIDAAPAVLILYE